MSVSRPMKSWTLLASMVASLILVSTSGQALATAAIPASASATPMVMLPDFSVLVDQVGPSVVNIRTLKRVPARNSGSTAPEGASPDMFEFFRRFGIPVPPQWQQPPRQPRQQPKQPDDSAQPLRPSGVGSGFIVSADGYIMTNAHVVDDSDEWVVTLADKREFKAKLIGADKRTDVALVKIDAKDLPAVKLGDVNRLKVGEWVMAIGSPYGLENTVTAGIVSAKQRETGDFLPFIQTDVAINPGNSGGPLINLRGEVVGINSQIYSRSGGFQGISFAIPMDEASRVADQLRSQGFVTRGRIGVSIGEIDKEMAGSLGLDAPKGALVGGVEKDSPAAKAGVEPGDVVLSFAGKSIEKSADLPRIVANVKPGTRVNMEVWRERQRKTLSVTVAALDDEAQAAASEPPVVAEGVLEEMGLKVRALTAEEGRTFGAGVWVVEVQGLAARFGVQAQDVIMAVGQQRVGSVAELQKALSRVKSEKAFNLVVRRGNWTHFLVIRP